MEDVYYQPQTLDQGNMDMFASNIKADRTSEDLLTQVLLDWGLPLTLKTEEAILEGKEVFKVAGDSLYACFDEGLDEAFAKLSEEKRFVWSSRTVPLPATQPKSTCSNCSSNSVPTPN